MANIKSAKKRVRMGERNRRMNRFYKSSIKSLVKKYRTNIKQFATSRDTETYETLKLLVSKIYSRIDKAAKKKVFHLRKAARQKSRISKVLKKLGKP